MREKLKELFFKIMDVFIVFAFGASFNKVANTPLTTIELIIFIFTALGTCCIVQKETMRIFSDKKEQETKNGG